MLRIPPGSTRTDTLFPYTTLFRSQGRRRWRGRVIVAVVAALEAGRIGADERPCDDAADAVFVHILARDLAQAVQAFQPERLLVRGDLQHRIGRGVEDRLAAADVLHAQRGDDRGPRGLGVAEQAGGAGAWGGG